MSCSLLLTTEEPMVNSRFRIFFFFFSEGFLDHNAKKGGKDR